jgi:hypothetical protein
MGEAVRDPAPLAMDRGHGSAVTTALGFTVEAGWTGWADSIAAHLLHAVGQPICPASCGGVVEGFAFADLNDAGSAGMPAADGSFQFRPEARGQVQDHVQVFAPVTLIVLAEPDPPASAKPAPTPCGDPVAETREEGVQISVRLSIEIDGVEVERGLETVADLVGEVLGPDGIAPLPGRDPLGCCLPASVEAASTSLPWLL